MTRTIESGPDPESFDLVGTDQLVVSNEDAGQASIVNIGSSKVRMRVPAGDEPEGVTTAPDGTVWITSEANHAITAIDPKTGAVLGRVETGKRPRSIAFTSDGALGVVTNENDATVTLFDPEKRESIEHVALPAGTRPMGTVIASRTAYITTGRAKSVVVLDLETREVTHVIADVGDRPWGIARDREGLLYTANGPSNDVSVIDLDDERVVQRIAVGASPWGVALWP